MDYTTPDASKLADMLRVYDLQQNGISQNQENAQQGGFVPQAPKVGFVPNAVGPNPLDLLNSGMFSFDELVNMPQQGR